jgi:hypothetical protein
MGVFRFSVAGTSYSVDSSSLGSLAVGQWYHLAGTFDGSTARIFVNGLLAGAISKSGPIDPPTSFGIASFDTLSDLFLGETVETRLSSTVRYTTTFSPSLASFSVDASTRGLWHLDEGSGSTAADASPNANSGVLVGPPTWVTDSPIGRSHTAPANSGIRTSGVQATVATIVWTTNQPSSSQVAYGTSPSYDSATAVDPSLVTTHTVRLGGLAPSKLYNYQVISRNAAGDQTASTNFTFTTTSPNATSAMIGEWSPVMNWPAVAVDATLLYTGDILLWDAWESPGTPSARLWRPGTQTFTRVPNLTSQLFCSAHISLDDGRILVIGGHQGGQTGIPDANIFDPATSSWSQAASMAFARWYPSLTKLADGRAIAFSGQSTTGPDFFANTPEVYDASTNSWTRLASINTSDFTEIQYPQSYLLPSGQLFSLSPLAGSSRLLDVATQSYVPATPSLSPVLNGSTVMYRPGKILAVGGGHNIASETVAAILDTTAASPTWRSVAPMAFARTYHNLRSLPDGKVLAIGGSNLVDSSPGGPLSAELWDPSTETWATLASQRDPRMYHSTAVLLPDGRVLVAGGGRLFPDLDYYSAEIYSPPYLFKGARPTITAAPSTASYNAPISVTTPDAASIGSVTLTDLGSVSHTLDFDGHFVELAFTRSSTGLTVQMPASANLAPPGYYMLWILNSSGVPSVARIVRLGGPVRPQRAVQTMSPSTLASTHTTSQPPAPTRASHAGHLPGQNRLVARWPTDQTAPTAIRERDHPVVFPGFWCLVPND